MDQKRDEITRSEDRDEEHRDYEEQVDHLCVRIDMIIAKWRARKGTTRLTKSHLRVRSRNRGDEGNIFYALLLENKLLWSQNKRFPQIFHGRL